MVEPLKDRTTSTGSSSRWVQPTGPTASIWIPFSSTWNCATPRRLAADLLAELWSTSRTGQLRALAQLLGDRGLTGAAVSGRHRASRRIDAHRRATAAQLSLRQLLVPMLAVKSRWNPCSRSRDSPNRSHGAGVAAKGIHYSWHAAQLWPRSRRIGWRSCASIRSTAETRSTVDRAWECGSEPDRGASQERCVMTTESPAPHLPRRP